MYNDYLVDTIQLLKQVDKPHLLENGIKGVQKVRKLLNWGLLQDDIKIKKQVIEKRKL